MALGRGDVDALFACEDVLRRGDGGVGAAGGAETLVVPFENAAQPIHLLRTQGVLARRSFAPCRGFFLVCPMGADAEFRFFVHFPGSDLHFEHLAGRPDDRGVNRAIAVFLWIGDVVVELAGDGRPRGMNESEHAVAVVDALHQHARRLHVVDLGKRDGLVAHLLPDAVDVLGAALDFAVDAGRGKPKLQVLANGFHLPFAGVAAAVEIGDDFLVVLRIQLVERQVLE